MNLAELGFTKEELQERVVAQCVERVLSGVGCDEYGDVYDDTSPLYKKLHAELQARVDDAIRKIGEEKFAPKLIEHIENIVMQRTTKWGEKVGAPLTFIEYLTHRAGAYFTEEVDSQGRTRDECRSRGSSFYGGAARVAYLVDSHLKYQIETAMKGALEQANKTLVDGLAKTAKLQLEEIAKKLKVEVKV